MRAKLQFFVWWVLWSCAVLSPVVVTSPKAGPVLAMGIFALVLLYRYVEVEADPVIQMLNPAIRVCIIIAVLVGVFSTKSAIILYILGPAAIVFYYYEEVPALESRIRRKSWAVQTRDDSE